MAATDIVTGVPAQADCETGEVVMAGEVVTVSVAAVVVTVPQAFVRTAR